MWVVVFIATMFIHGCTTYDYERGAIENSTSVDNSLILDSLELAALNGRDGEIMTYQNGDLLQQVTPFNMRVDRYTGKQCRDFHTDFTFRQERKSIEKTACRYDGQWRIVSIGGKSVVRSSYHPYGYQGYGTPGWMRGYGYVNPMINNNYGGGGYYGGRSGIGGSVYFNGRW